MPLYAPISPVTQNLLFSPDNTRDIGAAATGRPKDVYIAGQITVSSAAAIGSISGTGFIQAATTRYIGWNARAVIAAPAASVLTLGNFAEPPTDFGRLQFGGTSSSFPAIKRNAAILEARLADDSAAGTWQGKYNSSDGSAGVSAGPFTTISSITVKDGLVTALTGS